MSLSLPIDQRPFVLHILHACNPVRTDMPMAIYYHVGYSKYPLALDQVHAQTTSNHIFRLLCMRIRSILSNFRKSKLMFLSNNYPPILPITMYVLDNTKGRAQIQTRDLDH